MEWNLYVVSIKPCGNQIKLLYNYLYIRRKTYSKYKHFLQISTTFAYCKTSATEILPADLL